VRSIVLREVEMGVLLMADEALGGEGGDAGMKNDGIHAAVAIHDTINTVVGTSPRNGLINDASAAPNGFAKLANAVAPTLPPSVNHISLYRVGAASTKGCASPVNI
jgi:hypothetical protein